MPGTKLQRDVCCILGLPFDMVDLDGAAAIIEAGVDSPIQCFLSTPNLNFVVSALSDEAFFQSVLDSDLSVADGMPIVWVAKLLGIPLQERVAGSSLFKVLSDEVREEKMKVFFFGGQPGIAELAHDRLNRDSLGMRCCGFYDPGFGSVEEMS